ncbi:MAG: hypothetical protein WBV69_15220, partial [Candidatus Sulfotelmatobacter sp.]
CWGAFQCVILSWACEPSNGRPARKTAVSMPDDLFRLAEAAARRLRISRSQLYALAISEFLSQNGATTVTERLNRSS